MNAVEYVSVCAGGGLGVCVWFVFFCSLRLEAIVLSPKICEHQRTPAAIGVTITEPLPSTR